MAGEFLQVYAALRQAYGHRQWWPAQTPFEVIVGAVLTQNTNWKNVEQAIANLKGAGLIEPDLLAQAPVTQVQDLIRPAGYFRQKAGRLRRVSEWVCRRWAPGDRRLDLLRREPADVLREELLAINGVGPETADSILLYALEKPVFVVDAYTVRVFARHGLIAGEAGYEEVQQEFQRRLPPDLELFKDFHAQLVEVGKRCCKRRGPRCAECPLRPLLGEPMLEDEAP